jgi:hypothetical protein
MRAFLAALPPWDVTVAEMTAALPEVAEVQRADTSAWDRLRAGQPEAVTPEDVRCLEQLDADDILNFAVKRDPGTFALLVGRSEAIRKAVFETKPADRLAFDVVNYGGEPLLAHLLEAHEAYGLSRAEFLDGIVATAHIFTHARDVEKMLRHVHFSKARLEELYVAAVERMATDAALLYDAALNRPSGLHT